jgi:hypothetical protein
MAALKAPPTQDFVQKTLGAQLLEGATSAATFNNMTGIPNLPGVFIVDRINSAGDATPSLVEVIGYTATSGSTVTTLSRGLAGTNDQDHAINAVVEFVPSVVWAQTIYDALTEVVSASTGLLDTTKVVTPTGTQTLTNKTLTSPDIDLGSDAAGDIYSRDSAGELVRIAKGTPRQALVANASLPAWTSAGVQTPYVDLADASTMYMDFAVGNKWKATIVPSGARTFLATNATVGDVGILRVQYASTASLAVNFLTAGATLSWAANATLSPTATVAKADLIGLVCMATLPKFDLTIIGQGY